MKIIIAALALLALAAAVPLDKEPVKEKVSEPVKILRSEHDQSPDGKYAFNYESEDGSARQEEGTPKEVLDEEQKPHTVVVVRGAYSYVNPEGKTDVITYEADEKGYRAYGDSIPQAPVPQTSSRR